MATLEPFGGDLLIAVALKPKNAVESSGLSAIAHPEPRLIPKGKTVRVKRERAATGASGT